MELDKPDLLLLNRLLELEVREVVEEAHQGFDNQDYYYELMTLKRKIEAQLKEE